jgi:hypothetical protein
LTVSTPSVVEQKVPIKSCLRFDKLIVLDPLSSPAASPKRVSKGCFKLPMSADDLDRMPTAGDNAYTDDDVIWCKETIRYLRGLLDNQAKREELEKEHNAHGALEAENM